MNYFEVKERLSNLKEFRQLYDEYMQFTNREKNVVALLTRRKMEPLVALAVDSLKQVGLGSMITRDAPVRGGRKVRINLIKAIFRDNLIRQFSLDDKTPMELLDKGIIKYKCLLWRQKVQLFNPLFWLFHFTGFLAISPLYILKRAGYDTGNAEKMSLVKFYILIFQLAAFYFLLQWSGTIAFIKFDILGL
ncbi:MAG: hypothetical protein PHN52_03350 [candidate division Zixibacteria bacterium]|nr:hypothetical protein [candidate division Zixibacteria bacterium]